MFCCWTQHNQGYSNSILSWKLFSKNYSKKWKVNSTIFLHFFKPYFNKLTLKWVMLEGNYTRLWMAYATVSSISTWAMRLSGLVTPGILYLSNRKIHDNHYRSYTYKFPAIKNVFSEYKKVMFSIPFHF